MKRIARRVAFTLVELLVVVAIIATLMAVLLPSLSKAKARAKAVLCGANLRAVGTAGATYLSEYNRHLPVRNDFDLEPPDNTQWYNTDTPGSNTYAANQIRWFDVLAPYLGMNHPYTKSLGGRVMDGTWTKFKSELKVLWCPEDPSLKQNDSFRASSYAVPGNVMIAFRENAPGTGDGLSVPATGNNFNNIRNESAVVFLGESNQGAWYHIYAILAEGYLPYSDIAAGFYMHDWKSNFLFFDGHIELQKLTPHSMDYRVINGTFADSSPWSSTGSAAFMQQYAQ